MTNILRGLMITKNTEVSSSSKRRLDKACDFVSDMWFPVDSKLLSKIKAGIQDGYYDLDHEALLSNVSSDFSLYMYCLRELLLMLKAEGVEAPPLSNPLDVLRQGGLERLKKILNVEEAAISSHSYENIDEFQVLRLKETLVSASTAQALSTSFNIQEEVGYSAALIRQLGHTLIAWNYPSIYKEALSSLTTESNLDYLIASRLGFSPTLLAIKVLMSWGMPMQLCEALFLFDDDEDDDAEIENTIFNILGGTLSKLCSIGEALARANNPAIYPKASQDWEFAKKEISNHLGTDGIQYIQEALRENVENYLTFLPEVYNGGLILDPELHIAEHKKEQIIARNPYISLCDQPLRSRLTAIYSTLTNGGISEGHLSNLIKEIIPASGFSGGIIYTIDPTLSMLVAQTQIGNLQLKSMKPIDYSIVLSNADSVAVAFRSNEPVVEYRSNKSKELYTGITGIIGYSNRAGVLYLEAPYQAFQEQERAFLIAFKAYCRSISDCLNLL